MAVTDKENLQGYNLTQSVSIESKEVGKIENLSRTVTEIINKGIEHFFSTDVFLYQACRCKTTNDCRCNQGCQRTG